MLTVKQAIQLNEYIAGQYVFQETVASLTASGNWPTTAGLGYRNARNEPLVQAHSAAVNVFLSAIGKP